MTIEPFDSQNNETDERLRRLISRAIGPDSQSDDEIERLLDEVSAAALPDEQVLRILGSVFDVEQQEVAPIKVAPMEVPPMDVAQTVPQEGRDSYSANRFSLPRVAHSQGTPDPFRIQNRIADLNPPPRTAAAIVLSPRVAQPASIGRGALAAVLVSAMCLLVACFVAPQTQPATNTANPISGGSPMAIANSAPAWFSTLQRQAIRFVAAPVPATTPAEPVRVGDVIETRPLEKRRLHLPDGSVLYVNEKTKVNVAGTRRIKVVVGEVFVEVVPEFDANANKQQFVVETSTRNLTALGTKFGVNTNPNETNVVVTQGLVDVGGTHVPAGQHASIMADELLVDTAPRASHALWWTEELMTAAAAVIVPQSQYLGGRLISVDPNGQDMQLSLRNYHVDVHIEDGFARTTIDQTYFNHTWQRLEGTFYFPLPADASLSRLAMYVGEKLMEGGMAERDHARNVYEEIRHTKRDPALLEWVDGTTFKMRVFPLEARQEKRLVLSYTQRLNSAYGKTHYRFPAGHNMDVVRNWSTRITAKGAANREWNSPSHSLQSETKDGNLILTSEIQNSTMDRDIVLELKDDWVVKKKRPRRADDRTRLARAVHDEHQYLMVRHRPRLSGEHIRPHRRWVILFETSGDRDPVLARTQIEVIRTFLQNAEHKDQFAIVAAGSKARHWKKTFIDCSPKNVAAAIEALEETQLIGALDLESALKQCDRLLAGSPAFQKSRASDATDNITRENVLVHVGSGLPVLGVTAENELTKLIPSAVRYVGLGIGRRWSRQFMKQAASKTGGYFTQINPDEKVAWRAFEAFSVLNAPRLLNLSVADEPGEQKFRTWTDSIADGEEICAITRLAKDAQLPSAIVVRGETNGEPWKVNIALNDSSPIDDQAEYLPRSWAKLEIDRLVAKGAANNKQAIIDLSKAMYVMSPFTSLLVLENENMYARYKVDRGRRDHWALYPCPDTIKVVYEPGAPTQQPQETENLAEAVLPDGPLSPYDAVNSVLNRPLPQWVQWPVPVAFNQHGTPIAWNYLDSQNGRWGRTNRFYNRELIESQFNLYGETSSVRLNDRDGEAPVFGGDGAVSYSWNGNMPPVHFEYDDLEFGHRMDGYRADVSKGDSMRGREAASRFGTRITDWVEDSNGDGATDSFFVLRDYGFQTPVFGRPGVRTVISSMPESLNRRNRVQVPFSGQTWGVLTDIDSNGLTYSVQLPNYPTHMTWAMPAPERPLGTVRADAWISRMSRRNRLGESPVSRFRRLPTEKFTPVLEGVRQQVQVHRSIDALSSYFQDEWIEPATHPIRMMIQLPAEQELAQQLLTRNLNTTAEVSVNQEDFGLSLKDTRGSKQLIPAEGIQPQFGVRRDVFGDLVAYAPGMHVSHTDRLSVVESETTKRDITIGSIDKAARKLIDEARARDWEHITIGGGDGLTMQVHGAGHFTWKRTLPEGLGETVVCNGQTLWHLYNEIGLGSKRTNSRFHQAALRRLVPWLVASADELARGANVTTTDDHTIVVRPIVPGTLIQDGKKPPKVVELHMVFDDEHRLIERRFVMENKVLLRQTYAATGKVQTFNRDNKVIAEATFERTSTVAPDLKANTDGLVVMPMPYRSIAAVKRGLSKPDTPMKEWDEATALSMLGAYIAQAKSQAAVDLLKQRFFDQGDQRIGLTVLLGTRFPGAMYNGNDVDLRPGVERSPLAQFMRQYMTWIQSGNDNTEFAIDADENKFVQRMATARNLYHRWNGGLATTNRTNNQIRVELQRTLDFIATCDSRLGWTLLSVVQPRVTDPDLNELLADAARRFADSPQLEWLAKTARIRSLFIAGKNGKARREYRELLFDSLNAGRTPVIEKDLQESFRNRGNGPHLWRQLCKDMQNFVIEHKLLRTAVNLSIQLRALRFEDAADNMLTAALKQLDVQQRPDVAGLAVGQLHQLQRFDQAEQFLSPLLEMSELQFDSKLWRYAADLAEKHGKKKVAVERLERALAVEFQFRSDVIDLQKLRTDYGNLLSKYTAIVDAAETLGQDPPPDLAARVIAVADRWRMLDDNDTPSCNAAATILTRLGDRERAWDYLTTPLATNPADSQTWVSMARHLRKDHDFERAHSAFAKAYGFEQTNPDILLEHARSLRKYGDTDAAQKLFEQIARGKWQPRFANTKKEAQRVVNEMK